MVLLRNGYLTVISWPSEAPPCKRKRTLESSIRPAAAPSAGGVGNAYGFRSQEQFVCAVVYIRYLLVLLRPFLDTPQFPCPCPRPCRARARAPARAREPKRKE